MMAMRRVLAYCEELAPRWASQMCWVNRCACCSTRPPRPRKRWGWVKKGAPMIVEVGGRDVAGGKVSVLRRDRLYKDAGKTNSAILPRDAFVAEAAAMLADIQAASMRKPRRGSKAISAAM
jgi:prolyl-tRNA synthetase